MPILEYPVRCARQAATVPKLKPINYHPKLIVKNMKMKEKLVQIWIGDTLNRKKINLPLEVHETLMDCVF